MKVTTHLGDKSEITLGTLIHMHGSKERTLRFNEEYQRAPAWKPRQKQMFIDSVFRGYSIPAFYLHKVQRTGDDPFGTDTVGTMHYEVIDGQQRIRAASEFKSGGFSLLQPDEFKLPRFLEEKQSPEWAGCTYDSLTDELKKEFLSQPVVVYVMETEDDNEIRDLFIRLQGGTPLSAQDKRDTYPGELSEFVKKVAGKAPLNEKDLILYHGHQFFNELVWGKEKVAHKRQLASQLLLLLEKNLSCGELSFNAIGSPALDDFYWRHSTNFTDDGTLAKRFRQIIDGLCESLPVGKMPPLRAHEAIHLCLLFHSLLEGYVDGWQKKLPDAFTQFRKNRSDADKKKAGGYYMRYERWIGQSAAAADTIERRHAFFAEEMLRMLSVQEKDSNRIFSSAEKQQIYLRDDGYCQWCKMKGRAEKVSFGNAEYHHVLPHAQGGKTTLENGALMHPDCHPKQMDGNVAEFREWWERQSSLAVAHEPSNRIQRKIADLPTGTKCRFEFEDDELVEGAIASNKLVIANLGEFTSFKHASETIIGGKPKTNRNWWLEWEIKLPESDHWIPADDWQPK